MVTIQVETTSYIYRRCYINMQKNKGVSTPTRLSNHNFYRHTFTTSAWAEETHLVVKRAHNRLCWQRFWVGMFGRVTRHAFNCLHAYRLSHTIVTLYILVNILFTLMTVNCRTMLEIQAIISGLIS